METETKTEETKVEDFQETGLSDIFDEGVKETPSTEVKGDKTEEKPQEEKKVEEKKEAPEDKVETKAEDKVEEKETKTEEKSEEKPSFDWESNDNPYKNRYEDTRNWATKLNQQNIDLQKSVDIVGKKVDGTYDEATENKADDKPSPEAVQFQENYQGRLTASKALAVEKYGQDFVNKMLLDDNAPFKELQKLPEVNMRVLHSPTPALEAIKIIKEKSFFDKYGRDVDTIADKIKAESEAELRDKITKEFREKLKLKNEQVVTLSGVQGDGVVKKTDKPTETPLGDIFDT